MTSLDLELSSQAGRPLFPIDPWKQLVERETDPLPMRMYGSSTRGALAERGESAAWVKRDTLLVREGKKRRKS